MGQNQHSKKVEPIAIQGKITLTLTKELHQCIGIKEAATKSTMLMAYSQQESVISKEARADEKQLCLGGAWS